MNWLRKFMMGRYGGDQLSMVLLIFSLLITFIAQLSGLPILAYISYVPLCISIYRILSRDIEKRRMENYKFAVAISPAYSWFNKMLKRAKDSKTHRYFKCPNCKTNLRVPKGKGKIVITCPKCNTEFREKT